MGLKRTVVKAKTAEEYLLRKSVAQSNGCIYFTSPLNIGGYGKIGATQWAKKYRINSAHQLAYILTYGEYDRQLIICHKCNNRRCINPDHLYAGTVQDNSNDMVNSGRSLIGSLNHQSKLTDESARYILINKDKYSLDELAEQLGVTKGTIWKVINRYNWRHVVC